MELTGKIVQLLPEQSGQGKNGTWRKQEFIIETNDQYPKKVCVSVWGDKIDQFPIVENKEVTASINIESREYNGRWYTDVRVWRLSEGSAAQASTPQSGGAAVPPPAEEDSLVSEEDTDDLPF